MMGTDNSNSEDQEDIPGELDAIGKILDSVENGDPDITYADTEPSMELIDELLGHDPDYQKLLPLRAESSRKITQSDDEDEKAEGIDEIRNWIEQVRQIVE
ncbi:MAG: hypothetical protein V1916_01855 [Patescibacteria group bacterium]